MPMYTWVCDHCCTQIVREYSYHEHLPKRVLCKKCRRMAWRDWQADQRSAQTGPTPGWPRSSQALAFHPKQVAEARALDRDHDYEDVRTTRYDATGAPEFRSRAHEQRWAKHHGYTNFDGGLTDP